MKIARKDIIAALDASEYYPSKLSTQVSFKRYTLCVQPLKNGFKLTWQKRNAS